MKKGEVYQGVVEDVVFPNKGIISLENGKQIIVKNTIPGQKISFSIQKIRKGKGEGRLLEILEKSPLEVSEPICPHFGICGGCTFLNMPLEEQLKLKSRQVLQLLDNVCKPYLEIGQVFQGIKESPRQYGYRNKMEFSFGDMEKGGPLTLGMHKRGSFHDIVTVAGCKLVDEDYTEILCSVLKYFQERKIPYYHKKNHEGYLRHLLVRKAVKTEEILVDLITSSQMEKEQEKLLLDGMKELLLSLPLKGKIVGILHTLNDSLADAVINQGTEILTGQDFFYEELLGLKFKISPFSFFQTNSLSAEVLYDTVREYIGDSLSDKADKIVFDLYSGTGTIAQMLSKVAHKVVGVEIVQEAVEAAIENAVFNGLDNCHFIAGDVLKVLDEITEKPDYIILDPPRDGVHPKALDKIIRYGVKNMVYISCKPTSLARDLEKFLLSGYQVRKVCCVDMFPASANVETIVLLEREC